jgi:hypothetical protein
MDLLVRLKLHIVGRWVGKASVCLFTLCLGAAISLSRAPWCGSSFFGRPHARRACGMWRVAAAPDGPAGAAQAASWAGGLLLMVC